MTLTLSRRSLIQASLSAAGGLIDRGVRARVRRRDDHCRRSRGARRPARRADEVNAFVVIDPDNTITLRVPKSEMGQGVLTSLAMILAEELECDFAKVKVEYASAHRNLIDEQRLSVDGHRGLRVGARLARLPAAGRRSAPGRGSSPRRRRSWGVEAGVRASPAAALSGMKPPGARRPSASSRPTPPRSRSPPSPRSRRPISSSSSARRSSASTRRSK